MDVNKKIVSAMLTEEEGGGGDEMSFYLPYMYLDDDEKHYLYLHWDSGWWSCVFLSKFINKTSYLVYLRFHLVQIVSYISTYAHMHVIYLTERGRGWGDEISFCYHICTWVRTINIICISIGIMGDKAVFLLYNL